MNNIAMQKIMFNDKYGLTKAVLEGRKTMTRRVVPERILEAYYAYDDFCNSVAPSDVPSFREWEQEFIIKRSPFKVGEVVAVAQAYKDILSPDSWSNDAGFTNKMFVKADLMPHQIRITDIDIEPLQDISDEDCLREGIVKALGLYGCEGLCERGDQLYFNTPRDAFAALIDKVCGYGTFESNPWVFVYEFELVK